MDNDVERANRFLDRHGLSQEALAPLLEQYPVECAFVTGSFLEGRAGPTSDLDLRVVCCPSERHPHRDRSFYRADTLWCGTTFVTRVAGVPIHCVWWPSDAVELVRRKLDEAVLDGEQPLPLFSIEQMELVEELEVSLAVRGAARLADLRAALDLPKLREIRFQQLLSFYDQACGEAEAPLATGQPLMALLRSRRALNCACDCLLHRRGLRVAKEKWRLRHLREAAGADSELVQRYLDLALGAVDPGDEAAVRQRVLETLAWCNDLLLEVQLEPPAIRPEPVLVA